MEIESAKYFRGKLNDAERLLQEAKQLLKEMEESHKISTDASVIIIQEFKKQAKEEKQQLEDNDSAISYLNEKNGDLLTQVGQQDKQIKELQQQAKEKEIEYQALVTTANELRDKLHRISNNSMSTNSENDKLKQQLEIANKFINDIADHDHDLSTICIDLICEDAEKVQQKIREAKK